MDEFDQILEDCLENLSGGSSLDDCLMRYPGEAQHLRPLLETAAVLEQGGKLQPSPAFKARVRARLMTADALARQPAWRRQPVLRGWKLAVGLATFMIVLLTTETGFAQRALPGSPLYAWKLASEQVWRDVSYDPVSADLAISRRRASELLILREDPQFGDEALIYYKLALTQLTSNTDAGSQARIVPVLQSQRESFKQAGLSVPELEAYLLLNLPEGPEIPKDKKPHEADPPGGKP